MRGRKGERWEGGKSKKVVYGCKGGRRSGRKVEEVGRGYMDAG